MSWIPRYHIHQTCGESGYYNRVIKLYSLYDLMLKYAITNSHFLYEIAHTSPLFSQNCDNTVFFKMLFYHLCLPQIRMTVSACRVRM